MLPAVEAMGIKSVYISNVHNSDYTVYKSWNDTMKSAGIIDPRNRNATFFPSGVNGTGPRSNICEPHEYKIAESIGGTAALKMFVARCNASGIKPYSWSNNAQSTISPLYNNPDWFVETYNAGGPSIRPHAVFVSILLCSFCRTT
jgi:hypothetical protein